MKSFYFLPLLFLIFSCANQNSKFSNKKSYASEKQIITPEFQTIIDSADVNGSILIYDLEQGKQYSNNFDWTEKGNLPASTFKITNSIIALETGVAKSDSTLFIWDGKKRSMKIWEQDLILRDAFHLSCVPCFQQVAREIGVERMNNYLNKLNYGSMKVDSSSIDLFWLEGDSRISQQQQVDFLKRFHQSELPISKRTETIMKRMMIIEQNDNYKLSGKTGWSSENRDNGWFVGYIETDDDKTYFFATNIEPKEEFDIKMFPMIRKDITYKALKHLNVI